MVKIPIDEDTYKLLVDQGKELNLTPDEMALKLLTQAIEKAGLNMGETVRVEIEIPRNVWEALNKLANTFKLDSREIMARAVEGELDGTLANLFEEYTLPLRTEIQKILGVKP